MNKTDTCAISCWFDLLKEKCEETGDDINELIIEIKDHSYLHEPFDSFYGGKAFIAWGESYVYFPNADFKSVGFVSRNPPKNNSTEANN